MTQQKLDMFLMTNSKYFESYDLAKLRNELSGMDESKWNKIQILQFKDPTNMLIISLLGGSLGIDRFLIGDTGLGIGKLLTCGGLGIWTIIDLFLIMGAAREKNMFKIVEEIYS